MQFSYFVSGQCLLENIDLVTLPHTISLITGVVNVNLNLLTGILAKFFPCNDLLSIKNKKDSCRAVKNLSSSLSLYNGRVKIEKGNLPGSVVYVGPDPEKHLLFAIVNEEMVTQFGNGNGDDATKYFVTVLSLMGLNASFLQRHIASLSGGEKMKLALAIALAQKADCYVLQGVVPWLDKLGRECLWQQLHRLQVGGASIVFCENECIEMLPLVDNIYYFDGYRLFLSDDVATKVRLSRNNYSFEYLKTAVTSQHAKLIEFIDLSLFCHPHYASERTSSLLNKVCFSLFVGNTYLLFGNNGAGKSTITQLIFRLIKPDSGCIKLLGRNITTYSREQLKALICYVGQNPAQQLIFNTLGQCRRKLLDDTNELALHLFDNYFVGFPDEYPLANLTVIQYKILVLLTFVNCQTKLIILDEPTWGLDHIGCADLWRFVDKLAQRLNFTLFIISHDLGLASLFHAEILRLNDGSIFVTH